ncbi:SelT/SelW/SelH family protein [Haloarcula sp. CBA1130]|uniref:SelT/SelW/SelH family protein n=1 Tax=unclassified Haloarcula TaxID=2624677 RepID=UPI00124891E4|nr:MULTISPECIES: Rdx family protein [unclassified Haloarcula]KAA9398696.1 SelT/SelW/SelH family protein [Haloarcula sp. CBA1129]KAA9403213.1 SelT/SelW/SelH family protein [Haloarcula sp. CBA1130]
MSSVEIEYCVPCGFRERAVNVQQAILSGLEQELDSVRLVMGDHGVFRITVDDETVYDKAEAGDEFDVDAIVRKVRSHVI